MRPRPRCPRSRRTNPGRTGRRPLGRPGEQLATPAAIPAATALQLLDHRAPPRGRSLGRRPSTSGQLAARAGDLADLGMVLAFPGLTGPRREQGDLLHTERVRPKTASTLHNGVRQNLGLPSNPQVTRYNDWGERGDSNPRHPGPQNGRSSILLVMIRFKRPGRQRFLVSSAV